MHISLFQSSKSNKSTINLTIKALVKKIQSGEWEDIINRLREAPERRQKLIKQTKLPGVTLSGTFTMRRGKPLTHSSLLGIDLDDDYNEDLLSYRKKFKSDPYICGYWVSARGNGLRLIFRINKNKHLESFYGIEDYLSKKYQLIVDTSGKDEARLSFVTFDPDAYLDLTKKKFAQYISRIVPVFEESDAIDLNEAKKIVSTIVTSGKDIVPNYGSWYQIGQIFAELDEPGRELYHQVSQFHPNYDEAYTDRQFDACVMKCATKPKGAPTLGIATLVYYVNACGIKLPPSISFKKGESKSVDNPSDVDISNMVNLGLNKYLYNIWEFEIRPMKANSALIFCKGLNIESAANFLYTLGIRVWKSEFYMVKDNIIRKITKEEIQDILHKEAVALPKDLKIYFDANSNIINRKGVLDSSQSTIKSTVEKIVLRPLNIDKEKFLSDNHKSIYIPFSNGVLEITGKGKKLLEYESIDGLVWKEQIIDRNFKECKKKSIIQTILDNSIGKKNQESYMSAIGYMISTHFVVTGSPILFCSDLKLSDINDGGTGKDFIRQILSQVRRATNIDGKHIDFKNQFVFAKADVDTQIIWIEDLRKGVSMTNFYAFNEGITIRRLHTQPFDIRCKVGVSLQHSIEMEGNSDSRRQIFLAFGPHYRKLGGIQKQHGTIFGDEFKEWDSFYNFIADCCKLYLNKGVIQMNIEELKEIRKEALGGEGFERLEIGKWYTTEEAFGIWSEDEYLSFDKSTQMQFKVDWVKWCRLSDIELEQKKVTVEGERKIRYRMTKVAKGNQIAN